MKNRLFGYEKQTRFSFRKMSIGLISCGIGAFWIMGGTVMADEVTENTAESDIETVSTRTISEETTPVEVVKKSTVSIEKMSEQRELEGSAKQMIDLSEPHLKSKDVLEVGDTSVIPTVTTSASTEANRSITDEEAKTSEARLEETGVTNLRHVTIPEGVTEIGSSAFSDNPQLTKITLPSSLKKIGSNAFNGTNLTSIDLPEGLEEIGSEAFSGTKLTELVLPSSLKRIDAYAFRNISTLTKVHIPAHLESASNVFAYYNGDGTASPITEVSFESGIESIPSGLFNGVSSLTNVTIPSTVKRIGASAFSRTTLAEISIPEGVEYIGSSAFGNIERLKKVTLPSSVTNAYNAFSGSRNLTDVKLGAGFTKLPDSFLSGTGVTEFVVPEGVTEIGSSAFSDNPQLSKITLPRSLKKIGSNAFNGTGLTSVAIPEGVTDIGSYAFSSTPLERIILPTGLKTIGSGAFRNTKLIEIEIPEGVEYLDDYTLADNPQLKKVYLPKSITALVSRWGEQLPDAEFHVYLDSFALEYMIEHQLNFKLRDENVANDESKILDSQSSYYLPTTSSSRRQGYLGLDLKYSLKDGKSSDDGTYNLKLNIPASTTIFDGKVRYNGTDIPVSVQEGYITIPVTEKEGKIKLMLTSGNKELTNLRLFAQLAYQKDGQKVAEVIGATNVTVPVLTLTANKATSRTYSRISGVADPADRVTAYLDEQSIGLIKVKKDGTYTLDIPLANPVNNKEYKIKVVALSPDGQELSEVTTVRYEEKLPELENFIMRHNGYAYNMKEHKDKVPVINFRPGGKFEFEAEYTNTEQIENVYLVSTREGIEKYVHLYYDEDLGKYIYNGYFDEKNTSYVPGKLELRIINKEKRSPSFLIELEGEKIDYFSKNFEEKYQIIDELNNNKYITRIINKKTQQLVLTEEISVDILKRLFVNLQKHPKLESEGMSTLVKEQDNILGFRSAKDVEEGDIELNLLYAGILYLAENFNPLNLINPGKFALDQLSNLPELIFREYSGLSKDINTSRNNISSILDNQQSKDVIQSKLKKIPGLYKALTGNAIVEEVVNFAYRFTMLEILEKLLENPKLKIPGNYKYNALQSIKIDKNNFIESSIKSIGLSIGSLQPHIKLGALINDFGATFANFINGLDGEVKKWERIPSISGFPEAFYENIIDGLKIGAPTLTDLKVKTKLETKTSFTKKIEGPDTDGDGFSDSFEISNKMNEKVWDVGDRDLALFSLIAYRNQRELDNIFSSSTFTDNGIDFSTDSQVFKRWKPYLTEKIVNNTIMSVVKFVNKESKKIVFAFRGTDEGNQFPPTLEWADNIKNIPSSGSNHTQAVKQYISEELVKLKNSMAEGDYYDVYITGHSRGGHLAYQAIDKFLEEGMGGYVKKVINFNGPGLGILQIMEKERLKNTFVPIYSYSIYSDGFGTNNINAGIVATTSHPQEKYWQRLLRNPRGKKVIEHDMTSFFYYLSQGYRSSESQFESGLYSLKYTTTNTNSSGFTTSSIPTFQFIIDPSGVVINDISNNPVTGATTTLYYKGENGEEVLWDAGEYSQLNPLSTTVNGEYAWDVPEGQWKVKVSKDGYESAESDWLPVPPPQTEVHFKLRPLSYTLSYQVGDGALGKDAASTYQTDIDTALPYPVRKGYTFAGWYDNAALTGRPYFNTLFETAGDKELFAKWEKASDVLSDDESTLSITVNGIDTTRVSSISRKSLESAELLKKLPFQVSANDISFAKIQLLDSENKSISLTEEAEVEMATIGGRKPIKLLHYLADEDKFKEVPFKWIESNHSLAFSMTNSSVYAMVYQLSDTKQEVKVHKESRILKTDEVVYLDDPSLDTGRRREIPAVAGQVVVEITEIYVNGELQSSTEKELSRTPAQAKKVYRGTKLVTDIPNVAPIEEEKPEAKLETKVRQVIRVLTTDEVVYLDDPSLDTGRRREIPAVAGQVVVEITEIYVNGELQSSTEKELSRTPAQAKKVYRGTRSVNSVPSVAPTTPELSKEKVEMKTRLVVNSFPDVTYAGQSQSQIVYKNRKEDSTLPETGEKIYSVSVLTGLSLMLAGLYTLKKKEY